MLTVRYTSFVERGRGLKLTSLSTLLEEGRRHPLRMMRALVRRALEIPSRGLPELPPELKDDFDQRHGVETCRTVHVVVTDSPNLAHGQRYETTSEESIRWCIDNSGLDPKTATFLDLGCGKGRILIVAADYAFIKVVGVEYSTELADTCERNLRITNNLGRCTVVNEDAEQFALPDGDLLVYMNNPFKPELLRKIMARLADHPAKLTLAYRGPGHDTIQETGLFDKIARGPEGSNIYRPRHNGADGGLTGTGTQA